MRRVRKAVLPVAGLGTRFLPATKAMPKEMLTVVDRPVIQHAVQEALDSGIEQLIFVTGRGKTAIEDHFDHAFELEATLQSRGKLNALQTVEATNFPPGTIADADAEAVARGAAECFANSGQSCDAPTRMLVERSIYDQAVATAVATAEATAVDRASKSGDHMGPVVSELQYNKIQTLIEKGIAEGARLAAGGPGRPEGLEKGYFVQPTVFADVDNSMTIAREEIFGPVLSMIPFDDETDALRIANDTTYGLTNYVQTQDQAKGQRLARRLRSGMVQMNGTGLGPRTPFGGMRQSGNGREGGVWGIEDFIEVKTVSGWN